MYLNHRGNKLNNELQYGAHLTRWDWSPSVGCTAFVWLVADLVQPPRITSIIPGSKNISRQVTIRRFWSYCVSKNLGKLPTVDGYTGNIDGTHEDRPELRCSRQRQDVRAMFNQ
jgi:hypothetical protein